MREDLVETFEQTGRVMIELTEKAREAKQAGASRRTFFTRTAALAGATALGAAGAGLLQPIAARAATTTDSTITDTALDIFNVAATAESLAVTFYYYALTSKQLPDANSQMNRNYFQAAISQEFEHLRIFQSLGGNPLVSEFYFPTGMFTNQKVFFATAELIEAYFISAYIAAAREFSGAVSTGITKPDPLAIGLAVQLAGVESEHRVLLRVAYNQAPPNNFIIEEALVPSVGAAATALAPFLSPSKGYTGPFKPASEAEVIAISKPYDFQSFPKFTID